MEKEYKEHLDKQIERIIENDLIFKVTIIAIINLLTSDVALKGELDFYWRIAKALCNKDFNISYEEKEQFIAIHTASVEMLNEN